MVKKIDFLGIPLDTLTMDETITKIDNTIRSNNQIHHCAINAAKIVKLHYDLELKNSVINSDIINADGMSIVWAAKFLGYEINERVSGIDLMDNLIKLAHKNQYTCFFLGATQEVVEKLVDHYSKKFSRKIIAGFRNGYFSENDEIKIINKIKASNANLLFVAITSPKKEIFLNKYKNELSHINLIMGVGGSFDVISGKIKRAPKWMQELGLEWLYRFFQEPERMWKRYMIGNIKFILLVFRAKLNKHFEI